MKNSLLAFGFLILLFASCARPQALQYRGVDRVFLGSVNSSGLQLGVDVRLYNPNEYDLFLRGADLKAYINGRPAGKADLLSSTSVPARDTFSLPVTVALDASNLLGNAIDVLTQRDVLVRLEGTVRAGRGSKGIALPVRVRYEGRQKVKF